MKKYRYLYKYLSFNEGSMCVITKGTLKYTDPIEFNDPFDCRPEFDKASALDKVDELYPEMKRRYPSITKAEMRHNLESAIDAGKFHESPPHMKYGVLCLSRNPTNILMWSHYADNHRGFVVEFKIPLKLPEEVINNNDFVDMEYLIAMPVSYEEDRPIVFSSDNPEVGAKKTFYTKSHDWEYEQEERIISRDRNPGVYGYCKQDVLCSVITGVSMEAAKIKMLEEAVKTTSVELGREVKLRVARLERGKFGLEVGDS